NGWLAEHYTIKDPENKIWQDSLKNAMESGDMEAYRMVMDTISKMAKTQEFEEHKISPAQRDIYKTVGGAAHLDQNYTVFGETIEGMEVVDSIAATKVNGMNRPLQDVRIISMKIIPAESSKNIP
ncbi:MAG: peptidylprolyl isomerase, partial [Flavobacteriaceae bacterium]|nr:peptidylprolyl isomerase [Flavobacteriaceae bacterium]